MAIYGIGAHYDKQYDVSQDFIDSNFVGIGWASDKAPELHQFLQSLKVGDIIYIKSFSPRSTNINIMAIGIIVTSVIRKDEDDTNEIFSIGREVQWLNTEKFSIPKPKEKNNVRNNSLYEEFNPSVQREILNRIF